VTKWKPNSAESDMTPGGEIFLVNPLRINILVSKPFEYNILRDTLRIKTVFSIFCSRRRGGGASPRYGRQAKGSPKPGSFMVSSKCAKLPLRTMPAG
jgi:hypothetical protein